MISCQKLDIQGSPMIFGHTASSELIMPKSSTYGCVYIAPGTRPTPSPVHVSALTAPGTPFPLLRAHCFSALCVRSFLLARQLNNRVFVDASCNKCRRYALRESNASKSRALGSPTQNRLQHLRQGGSRHIPHTMSTPLASFNKRC